MRVLYTLASGRLGGGNKVLLALQSGLDRSRFEPLNAVPEPGPVIAELERLGLAWFQLDMRPGPRGRLATTLAITRLALRCLRKRARIVHANDPLTYRLAGMSAALAGAIRICHVHHPGLTPDFVRWVFRRPPHLAVTPSLFMKRHLETCLEEEGRPRVEAVWNPVDIDWFRPDDDVPALRARLGLEPQGKHVIVLAEVAPHKGHVCFLKAARQILDHHPDTTFHVVGAARDANQLYARELRCLAGELGLDERTRFHGFVPDEMARDLLAASDLFILPTQEEGFTLSAAEAQACRVPVLTSAIPPLDEVVDDGRTGWLLPPDDPTAFATRAVELLASPAARDAMGRAGRDWVVARFSRAVHVGRITALYEELATRRRVPQPATARTVGSLT